MKFFLTFSIFICVILYFIFVDKEVADDISEKKISTKFENNVTNKTQNEISNKQVALSNIITPQDLKNERAKYPDGVKLVSLYTANLSNEQRLRLKEDFENLNKYGNFNKNKLGNEFKGIKKYRKNINKNYPLSFTPIENEFLENNFNLTGKYASGVFSQDSGFDSYTRLFENKNTKQIVELTEMYLNPKNNTMIEVFKESFNHNINGVNLTFQEIPVGNTKVYTVDFVSNQKMYSLSTIKVDKKDVENLIFSLIEESNNFKN
jgi:hypothetical protein